jgi:hypothetical protein
MALLVDSILIKVKLCVVSSISQYSPLIYQPYIVQVTASCFLTMGSKYDKGGILNSKYNKTYYGISRDMSLFHFFYLSNYF